MDIITLIIGILVGGILGFLIARLLNKNSGQTDDVSFLKSQLQKVESELKGEREEKLIEVQKSSAASQKIELLNEKLKDQSKEIENIRTEMTREFRNIATGILDENSKKFTNQNKENLDSVLNPLKERIKEFEQKVDKTNKDRTEQQATLKAELKQLLELNQTLSEDARNLTTALKGESKTQGNWGEMILQRILERSGLKQGVEFDLQYTTRDAQGQQLRPDVLLKLPQGKHLVIDSKVSLVAYERLVNSEDLSEREGLIREHLTSIKNHIKDLSEKNYQKGSGIKSPDFVLLFIPIEASFGIAMSADQDLFNYAWDRKVVIVTPSTLLATLRTVASIWDQEKQNRNVAEIARLAGRLYDKFVAFTKDLSKTEDRLRLAGESLSDAKNKLVTGKGNMVSLAMRTKELGGKSISKKEFDPTLIDQAMGDDVVEEKNQEDEVENTD